MGEKKTVVLPKAKLLKKVCTPKKTANRSQSELAARVAEIHALREKVRKAIQRLQ